MFDIGIFHGQRADFSTWVSLPFFFGFWYLAFRMYKTAFFTVKTVIFWNDTHVIRQSVALKKKDVCLWTDLLELRAPSFLYWLIIAGRPGSGQQTLIFRDGIRISYFENMRGGEAFERKIADHLSAAVPDYGVGR